MTSDTQDPLSLDVDWGVVVISQHKGFNDKEAVCLLVIRLLLVR